MHLATEAPQQIDVLFRTNIKGSGMSQKQFQYDMMVQEALRGVVRKALEEVCKDGFRGEHHFYITFKTHSPQVQIPNFLRSRYPEEMTIVLQHQFWNLEIQDAYFEVELSFNDKRENLLIPFGAVTGFADPSVKFGLQFEEHADETPIQSKEENFNKMEPPEQNSDKSTEKFGEVVSLEKFRKNTDKKS